MRVVSLRARQPGSPPVQLHPRLTVVLGAAEADRGRIRSVFRALVGLEAPLLEVIGEVEGLTVPVDVSFADTFDTRGAPDPVVSVPLDSTLSPGGDAAVGARLAALRAEHRAVTGELALVERALRSERSSGDVMAAPELERRRRRLEELGSLAGLPGGEAVPRGRASSLDPRVPTLVGALRAALEQSGGTGSHELADRLEAVAERRGTDRARERALDQLMAESRAALEAARQASARELAPELDPLKLAEVERVREEMLQVVARPGVPNRRQRRHLEELRATESRLLAELGHATYASLVARSGGQAGDEAGVRAQVEARIALLEQLEEFWDLQRHNMDDDRREETALMVEAARVMGEPADSVRARSPRLVAARLRSAPARRLASEGSEVGRLAGQLEEALGIDVAVGRSPQDVLAVAEASLRGGAGGRPGGPPLGGGSAGVADGEQLRDVAEHAAQVRDAERLLAEGTARAARVAELEKMEQDLSVRLQGIEARLAGVERGAAMADRGAGRGGTGLLGLAEGSGPWSLADELARRRVEVAGGLPVLIEEPPAPAGSNALATVDPLSVVALSATAQLLWLTDRPEVAEAVARVGDMAEVITA